jgi:hypothetical protein
MGEFLNGKAQQRVPKSLAPYEDELNDIAERCHDMCVNLLKLLAVGLKVRTLPRKLQSYHLVPGRPPAQDRHSSHQLAKIA